MWHMPKPSDQLTFISWQLLNSHKHFICLSLPVCMSQTFSYNTDLCCVLEDVAWMWHRAPFVSQCGLFYLVEQWMSHWLRGIWWNKCNVIKKKRKVWVFQGDQWHRTPPQVRLVISCSNRLNKHLGRKQECQLWMRFVLIWISENKQSVETNLSVQDITATEILLYQHSGIY